MSCGIDGPTGRINGSRYETVYANLHLLVILVSSCNALLQEPSEGGADAQKHDDPEHRHDEGQRQTARKHQDVNKQDVDDDRSKQRQREWDVPIDQEQDRRNDLKQKYRDQIVRDEKRAF